MIIRTIIACTNANGEPDLTFVKVTCTQEQFDAGYHYELAEIWALGEGYEGPFVAFDEYDRAGETMLKLFVWKSASLIGA